MSRILETKPAHTPTTAIHALLSSIALTTSRSDASPSGLIFRHPSWPGTEVFEKAPQSAVPNVPGSLLINHASRCDVRFVALVSAPQYLMGRFCQYAAAERDRVWRAPTTVSTHTGRHIHINRITMMTGATTVSRYSRRSDLSSFEKTVEYATHQRGRERREIALTTVIAFVRDHCAHRRPLKLSDSIIVVTASRLAALRGRSPVCNLEVVPSCSLWRRFGRAPCRVADGGRRGRHPTLLSDLARHRSHRCAFLKGGGVVVRMLPLRRVSRMKYKNGSPSAHIVKTDEYPRLRCLSSRKPCGISVLSASAQ